VAAGRCKDQPFQRGRKLDYGDEAKPAVAPEETGRETEATKPSAKPEAKPNVSFHPSDLKKVVAPPTIKEKQKALEELADLRQADPLEYAEKRKEWAERLCTTREALDQAVRLVLNKRSDDDEQSQSTKLLAIGVSEDVRLWHSPERDGYASVRVGGHWENYKLDRQAFEDWLLNEYGRRHQVRNGNEWVPQAPNAGALKAAIVQLKAIAKFGAVKRQPAIRVGGDRGVIWIDLGRADWKAVRVTAEGWDIVPGSDVAFIRGGTMLPLPEPLRGGSVEPLRRVINLWHSDLVLVGGWMLQALNPIGPYPLVDVCGSSEEGKSTIARFVRQTVDPNVMALRKSSRKVEDLMIAANNGWVLSYDNELDDCRVKRRSLHAVNRHRHGHSCPLHQ
jgi:hypothetical protein